MRRNSALVALAFVVGLGIGYFLRSVGKGTAQKPDRDTDLAAIERLHKRLKIDLALFDSGLKQIAAAGLQFQHG